MIQAFGKLARAAFVLSFAAVSIPAHAVFLYVDLNNNPGEIDAVRAGLAQRAGKGKQPERLVSVPEQDPEKSKALSKLIRARDDAYDKFQKQQCYRQFGCQAEPEGACKAIYQDLKGKEKAAADAMNGISFDPSMLEKAMASLHLAPGEHVEIAISGHDGGGNFEGNLGKLSYADLKKIADKHPGVALNTNALYLLGCYTNTPPLIEYNWRDAFPGALFVGGYWDRSPRGDRPMNAQIIRKLVARSQDYIGGLAAQNFNKVLAELKPFARESVSVAVCDLYGRAGSSPQDLDQSRVDISRCRADLAGSDLQYYHDVFDGKIPFPEKGEPARLRAYYSRFRTDADCLANPQFLQEHPDLPNPDALLRLVLYHSLVANVKQMHQSDFANLDALLKALGLPESDAFSAVDPLNRAELLDWQRRVNAKLDQSGDHDRAEKARKGLQGIYDTLVNTYPGCISVMMLEGAPERSSCINLEGACQ